MGIYQTLYELLTQYVYGGNALNGDQTLTLTVLSTIGCLFVVAVPFLLVWRVITMLCNRW